MGLRARLILLVLVPVLPALILAVYTHREQRRFEAYKVEIEAISVARAAAEKQNDLIQATRQILDLIARLPETRGTNLPLFDAFFGNMPKARTNYIDVGLIEKSGDLVSSSFRRKGPVNLASEAHFQRVIHQQSPAIGNYQAGEGTNKPSLPIGYPVFDEKGRLTRVLYAALDLEAISRLAAKAKLPEGGVIRVIDRTGHILALYPQPKKWAGKFLTESNVMATMKAKMEGSLETRGLDGVSSLYAFTSIRDGEEAGLFVSVGIPAALAYAKVKQIFIRNLILLGMVTVFVLVSAWFYANSYILSPVKALAATTTKVAAGDLSARTGITGTDGELNQLANAFDKMAASLEEQRIETERSAQALRESEQRVRLVLDTALDAVITIDEQGVITSWNREAEKIFGWDYQEIIGQKLSSSIIPARYREAHERGLKHFLDTKEAAVLNKRIEIAALRRNGHEFPVELAITPIRLGSQYIFSAFVRDITMRKRVEETRAQLAAIIESSDDAILSKTLDGVITSWNPGAERTFGYSAQEVLGKQMLKLFPPDRVGEEVENLARIARGESIEHFETVRVRKDGKQIHVSVTISPIKNNRDQIVGASKIARDITEQRRVEEQFAASLREKETLLKEIHHRVKNNLQVISSLLSLQSNFIRDPQAREMVRKSQDRVKLIALIHEKLYQSRDLARIEFREYIQNLLSMVFEAHRSKSDTIKLDLQIDSIFLDIHIAVPVSLILNEMVSNCFKHAFPDGHSGVVTIYFKKHPEGQFNLIVRDNGIGVPKDIDLENTVSLGLRLIKILVHQIGGTLAFHSQGGTEFNVTFSEQSANETNET